MLDLITPIQDATTTFGFSEEDIKSAIDDLDVQLRPYALYCHPDNKDILDEKLGKEYLIVSNPVVPKDKTIVVDRRKLTLSELVKPFVMV